MSLLKSLAAAFFIALSAAASGGCAGYHGEAAAQEQRAADDLRRGGAAEAGKAAQDRADQHRKAASCDGLLDCTVYLVFGVVEGLLFPTKPDR